MFQEKLWVTVFALVCCAGAQAEPVSSAGENPSVSPSSQTLSASGLAEVNGRVLVMHTHPQDEKKMWAGTAQGGLWYSKDSGHSWQLVDEAMRKLPVAAIAAEPSESGIMYAGTGDGRKGGAAAGGRGIFRSSDGGTSWQPLPLTDPQWVGEKWSHVNSLAVNTEGVLLAATSDKRRNGYIFRSTDGGQSWGLLPVYDGSKVGPHNMIHKVRFDSDNPNTAIFMDDYANITHSTDGGITWLVARKSTTCK